METPPPPKQTLTGILSESQRIITSNYTHFITLSLLFIPLSLSLIYLLDLINFLQPHHNNTYPYYYYYYIFYILIVYLLSLSAIATITYTTHHAFFGTKVNFSTTFKSLTSSFFPIITTAIISHGLVIILGLSFLLFMEFVTGYNSVDFMWFSIITCVIFILLVSCFYVNWSLAFVVAVVESKSGFSALKRSSDLVKGMRLVSLALFLHFGFIVGQSVWVLSDGIHLLRGAWYVVFVTMFGCGLMMWCLCHMIAATTMLYNYCRALHGEVVIDGLFDDKGTNVVEV